MNKYSPQWRSLRRLCIPIFATLLFFTIATAGSANASSHWHRSHAKTCSGGTISGTYDTLRITGPCVVPFPGSLTVHGNVVVSGSHAALRSYSPAPVRIDGNVIVRQGGLFGVGNPAPQGQPCVATDTIGGNVFANGGLTVILNCTKVDGNVISLGGGDRSATSQCDTAAPLAVNFVVKDNVINGNIAVSGWRGCWLGILRNQVNGNVALLGNHPARMDGNVVVDNTISANLICYANSPAPQIGFAHSNFYPPALNHVAGNRIGQCKHIQVPIQ